MPHTSFPTTAEDAAAIDAIVSKARLATLQDPRPKLGLEIIAKAERVRGVALKIALGRGGEASDMLEAWAKNSLIALAAADAIEALAAQLPAPPEPVKGLEHEPHSWEKWQEVEHGKREPTLYQQRLMQAVGEAVAAGLSYNADVGPRCAAIMAARWGYPDARHGAVADAEWRAAKGFGSNCYSARNVLRARKKAEELAQAAMSLVVGQRFKRLIFSGRNHVTSAALESLSPNGTSVVVRGKRGRGTVEFRGTAGEVLAAASRADEWKQARAARR